VYGTVRTVVWEDGEGDFPSYPIIGEAAVPVITGGVHESAVSF